ncbi:MAG: dihydrodipicolinate synthase family protein [Clostridia bacterium]
MKTKEQYGGLYAASITAFDTKGNLDGDALLKVMTRNIDEGGSGLFVGGSSGECFLLSETERIACFEVGASLKDRANLIAHVGAISTDEAIRYAKSAKQMGYDFVAATAPFYYGFSSKEVCQYYYDIAKEADVPVIIYNFPGNTHREFALSDPNFVELFKSDAIAGFKQTNYNLFQMERILNINPDLLAFNGFDETMVAGQALGAIGSIGSTFNMMLPHYKKIYDLASQGKKEEALALQIKANNCMEAMCSVGLIAAIKYVLGAQGYPVGDPRRPFTPLNDAQKQYVDDVLAKNLCN